MMFKTKIVMGWVAMAFGLASVVLVACSSSDPAASSAPEGQSCLPGQQSPCTCPGGESGFQVCEPSGASLGSCQCSSEGSDAASSGDTGASDAGNDAAVPIPINGLVAYYRGDGKDKSGNSNDLTGGMTLMTDRFGGSQAGKVLASTDGSLSIATHGLIPTNNQPFSFSVWERHLAGNVPLLQWGNYGIGGENSLSIGSQNVRVGPIAVFDGTKTLADGIWHHIVLTFDGTSAKLFVDNDLDSSRTLTFDASSGRFGIGNPCCAPSGGVELGSIDDVRVYNRVLTEPEINALYYEVK